MIGIVFAVLAMLASVVFLLLFREAERLDRIQTFEEWLEEQERK